jgi:hypothetical protein
MRSDQRNIVHQPASPRVDLDSAHLRQRRHVVSGIAEFHGDFYLKLGLSSCDPKWIHAGGVPVRQRRRESEPIVRKPRQDATSDIMAVSGGERHKPCFWIFDS